MNSTKSNQVITPAMQRGIDRFGELVEEYKRMKGVEGDVLGPGAADLYTGLVADSLHWARMIGIDPVLGMSEAYRLSLEESAE